VEGGRWPLKHTDLTRSETRKGETRTGMTYQRGAVWWVKY
jgi:hypothetical protein